MTRKLLLPALAAAGSVLYLAEGAMAAGPESRSMFYSFIVAGGFIGWLLILVDVASIAIIIEQFITIRREKILPPGLHGKIRRLFEQKQYREAIEFTSAEGSILSHVIHAGLNEAAHGYFAMTRAMEEANEERTTKLLRKIEILNIFGNVSPMLGLLGTVYGMILTFNAIVRAGGMPDAAGLADGVGTALVSTFWGLIVAIPALTAYGVLRNRIDGLSAETAVAAQELVDIFRPGSRKEPKEEPVEGARA